jgi:hypothetical protein
MTTTAGEKKSTGRGRKKAAETRRTSSRTSGSSSRSRAATTKRSEARSDTRASGGRRTAHLDLPGVSADFRAPELHMPHVPTPREMVRAAGSARTLLPPRDKMLYYGGLGVAAAVGVIEWPVAVAVGAGMAIAQRARREDTTRRSRTSSTES